MIQNRVNIFFIKQKLNFIFILLTITLILNIFSLQNAYSITVSDTVINRELFYKKSSLNIQGNLNDSNNKIVIIFRTQDSKELTFMLKEQISIFWIPTKKIEVINMYPVYYIISNFLNEYRYFLPINEILKEWNNIKINHNNKNFILEQIIKYNEVKNLYCVKNDLKIIQNTFTYSINLNSNLPLGKYDLIVYFLNNKWKVLKKEVKTIVIKQSGILDTLYNLNINNSILYAFICIFSSILIGGLAGILLNYSK